MKGDRFLIGILITIVVLIGLTTLIIFTRQGKEAYLTSDKPEDVVHNYALALFNHDFRKAYSYLADEEYKPTFNEFLENFENTYGNDLNEMALNIEESEVTGNKASVALHVLSKGYSAFNSYSQKWAQLIYQDGKWKLIDAGSYALWNYQWYQEPYEER